MISRGWKCSRTKGMSAGGALLMAPQSYRAAPAGPPQCDEWPWQGASAAGGGAEGGKILPRRGGRSMGEEELPKLTTRVRFPSPAPPLRNDYLPEPARVHGVYLVSRRKEAPCHRVAFRT